MMARTYTVTESETDDDVLYGLTDGDRLVMNDADIVLRSNDYWPISMFGGDVRATITAGRLEGVNGFYLLSNQGDDWQRLTFGRDARIVASNAGIWASSDLLEVQNAGRIEANRYGIRSVGTVHNADDPVPVAERVEIVNDGTIRIGANGLKDDARGILAEAGRVTVMNTGKIEMVGEREGAHGPVAVDLVEISGESRTILSNSGTISSSYHAVRAHNRGTGEALFVNAGVVVGLVDVEQLNNGGTITGTVYIDGTWAENSGKIDGHIYLTNSDGALFDAEFADARILIDGSTGKDRINGSKYGDKIYSKQGGDTVLAGDGDDYVSAHEGNDRVLGGKGDDTIYGGKNNDTLAGNEDDDEISGEDGNDVLQGHSGNDDLVGGDNDDMLTGGEGNDTLSGGSGNDRLVVAHAGDDILTGGTGDDVFLFYDNADGQHIIVDYGTGNDKVDLSRLDGIDNFGDVEDAMRQNGSYVILDLEELGGAGEVIFGNTTLSELTSGDFILN
jgi:Ca2+-binding RTX toxin-like protein